MESSQVNYRPTPFNLLRETILIWVLEPPVSSDLLVSHSIPSDNTITRGHFIFDYCILHLTSIQHKVSYLLFRIPFHPAFCVSSDPTLSSLALTTGVLSSGCLGLHMTSSIGGADMPVVVTLLNSYSGWVRALSPSDLVS